MKEAVRAFCGRYGMLTPGVGILAAVSGGRDSVCMLHVLHTLSEEMGFPLYAAHYNHLLRGEESDEDEAFTVRFCRSLGVPCLTGRGDVSGEAARTRSGTEETARRMRYAFLRQAARETGCERIATAHNADDNAETVLMHLLRGAGTRGLGGIPPVRDGLIRPLLAVPRTEIDRYLLQNGLSFREDRSNGDDCYTRNRLRHHILPAMREEAPDFCEKIFSASELLREDDRYLTSLAEEFLKKEGGNGCCSASRLSALPRPVGARAVMLLFGSSLSRGQVESVLALAAGEHPSAMLSLPGLTVCRQYDLLQAYTPSVSFSPFFLAPGESVTIPGTGVSVTCRTVNGEIIHKSFTTFRYHSDAICGRILIRPRREGDTIRLFGSGCTKSLKKLMIERRIPASVRNSVPVVSDEKGILAVYGIGADERVGSGSGSLIEIHFEEKEEYEQLSGT